MQWPASGFSARMDDAGTARSREGGVNVPEAMVDADAMESRSDGMEVVR